MEISLTRQGIGVESELGQLINHSVAKGRLVEREVIFRDRFFLDVGDEEVWASYRVGFADKIPIVIEDAERICRHEFDLLGSHMSSPGTSIDWHVDPISGYRWPKKLFSELKKAAYPDGSDVKLPWELSRMQHLPTLGKAYRLTTEERYAQEIVAQITHWLDDNPCPYGINWTCPMDVAIRIMNILWAYLFIKDSPAVSHDFKSRLGSSVFEHGQFVLFNLEYGLRDDGSITNGNHYLSNIVGLLHLGLICPEFKKAEVWKSVGINGLIEEMDRQVCSDGVNFESSIAYHRLVLELFTAGALLCRRNGVFLPNEFWKRLEQMFEFVLFVTRPDGKVPQVGDADDGRLFVLSDYGNWDRSDFRYLLSIGAVLFNRADMKARAEGFSEDAFWLLGPSEMATFTALEGDGIDLTSKAFPDAGLYVMRQGDRYLLACCGEVGTDGVGNHKHSDLLSFELYAGNKAFIVDPGAYVYTRQPDWRNKFRATAYHNTVVIDGEEQNRFNSRRMFEMTPDADVIVHEWLSTPDLDRLDVEHTGYARLDRPVRHRRIFQFDKLNKKERTWKIVDVLSGEGDHTADWYFHLDFGLALAWIGNGVFLTRCDGTNLEIAMHSDTPLSYDVEDGWVSRRYGQKLPGKILHMSGQFNRSCRTQLTISMV